MAFIVNGHLTASSVNGTTTTASFNAANQNTAASYDGDGNQTSTPGGTTLGYNPLSQTASVTAPGQPTASYTYTGSGQAGLTQAGPTSIQNSRLEGVTATVTSGTEVAYSRTPTGALNTLRAGGNNDYYLTDPHGTVVALIDASGNKVATFAYTPYGALTTTATGIGATNPFGYDSGYTTPAGLIHYGARFYNPTTATWTQLDPTGQSPVYVYAGDDPVNEVDPSGDSFFGAIGNALNSALNAITNALGGQCQVDFLEGNIALALGLLTAPISGGTGAAIGIAASIGLQAATTDICG